MFAPRLTTGMCGIIMVNEFATKAKGMFRLDSRLIYICGEGMMLREVKRVSEVKDIRRNMRVANGAFCNKETIR